MRVWRLTKAIYAASAYSGEGSRHIGGRWHHRGMPVVYTSESIALAAMEALVNMNTKYAPSGYVAVPADIPDAVPIEEVRVDDLPTNWRATPAPPDLRDIGLRWFVDARSVALVVPSAVIPLECNVILNPQHPDFGRLIIGDPEPFTFDSRLLGPSA